MMSRAFRLLLVAAAACAPLPACRARRGGSLGFVVSPHPSRAAAAALRRRPPSAPAPPVAPAPARWGVAARRAKKSSAQEEDAAELASAAAAADVDVDVDVVDNTNEEVKAEAEAKEEEEEEEEEEESEEALRDKEMMRQAILMATSAGGERGSHGPFPRPICGAVLVAEDGRVSPRGRGRGGRPLAGRGLGELATRRLRPSPLAHLVATRLPADPRAGTVRLRPPRRGGGLRGGRPVRDAPPRVVRGVARRRGAPAGRGRQRALRHARAQRQEAGVSDHSHVCVCVGGGGATRSPVVVAGAACSGGTSQN